MKAMSTLELPARKFLVRPLERIQNVSGGQSTTQFSDIRGMSARQLVPTNASFCNPWDLFTGLTQSCLVSGASFSLGS